MFKTSNWASPILQPTENYERRSLFPDPRYLPIPNSNSTNQLKSNTTLLFFKLNNNYILNKLNHYLWPFLRVIQNQIERANERNERNAICEYLETLIAIVPKTFVRNYWKKPKNGSSRITLWKLLLYDHKSHQSRNKHFCINRIRYFNFNLSPVFKVSRHSWDRHSATAGTHSPIPANRKLQSTKFSQSQNPMLSNSHSTTCPL